jgi:hypothetical protein
MQREDPKTHTINISLLCKQSFPSTLNKPWMPQITPNVQGLKNTRPKGVQNQGIWRFNPQQCHLASGIVSIITFLKREFPMSQALPAPCTGPECHRKPQIMSKVWRLQDQKVSKIKEFEGSIHSNVIWQLGLFQSLP